MKIFMFNVKKYRKCWLFWRNGIAVIIAETPTRARDLFRLAISNISYYRLPKDDDFELRIMYPLEGAYEEAVVFYE